MANDNRRRPPHGHDPEQARREATRAREARQKQSGSASRNSVHIPLGLAGMTSAKIQILPGTPSENVSCSWRDPDHTYSCDHFFRTCMHFFPESCRSRRFAKGPGRGGRKKAKEEAAAVKDPVSLTLSVVGDCTLGTDGTFDYDTSLNACYDNNGKDYFFKNVKASLRQMT